MAEDERPAQLETKDTRGSLIGYSPAPVPNTDRTGQQLTDEERRIADLHGDLSYHGSGMPEADAEKTGDADSTEKAETREQLPSSRRSTTKS